ncbi:lymphocyte antigen 6D-like [Monodelphis domestica]|uniref:lymphocyte antigen 6D-like n=1 Tax=Monodelphis domestica TaxID=13616 RepID=UPI0024E1D83F|nr:lymphocyte antigen 6D-like [Monodelphis domestica]
MEALLSVIMFVVLPYSNNDAFIPTTVKTASSDKSQLLGFNIEPRKGNLTGVITTEMTTVPESFLKCHVCSGDIQCSNPTKCNPEEKFCVFTKLETDKRRIIKYCSSTCPFQDIQERKYLQFYAACCVTDLCNYNILGEGHKLRVRFPMIAMTLVAYFIDAFQIEP